MLLAAAPAWFADNVVPIVLVTLGVLTLLIVRMVAKLWLRIALLALVVALAVFVYANRYAFETCARTCSCQIAEQDVTLPACDVDLTP